MSAIPGAAAVGRLRGRAVSRGGEAGRAALLSMLAVALMTAGCSPASQARPEGAGIFREVRIDGAVIRLGEPLPDAVPAPPAGDTIVALPARRIGGAAAIRVHLTRGGLVRTLWFDYSHRADYPAMLAEYVAMLGAPRKEPFRTGERAVWEDARTRFELVRDPERSAGPVYGILGDRAGGTIPSRTTP